MVSSTATGPVSVSDMGAGRGSQATPNPDSVGRAREATVPAKAVGAIAEAIQAVRVGTDRVRDPAEAAGASAVVDTASLVRIHRSNPG